MSEAERVTARRTDAGAAPAGFPCVLIGDIGGTTSRLALLSPDGQPERTRVVANDTVTGIDVLLRDFIAAVEARPSHAVLAIAGPVVDGEIVMNNRGWRIRVDDLRRRFGFDQLHVLNDFEALAAGVPRYQAADMHRIGEARPRAGETMAVLGPGTGMGVAALPFVRGEHCVLASQGGHVSFGPADAREQAIFDAVRADHGYVSAEAMLSGPGLARLYRLMNAGAAARNPREIVAAAHAGEPGARAAAQLFVRLLGRYAGDVALMFKATGGVYIAGNIARALATMLDAPDFRAAFEAHPPFEPLMRQIATILITRPEPGLFGAATVAHELVAEAASA